MNKKKELLYSTIPVGDQFHIVLEKGKAKKSIFEMTPEEIHEAGERIFKKATIKAAAIGQFPVVEQKAVLKQNISIEQARQLYKQKKSGMGC